MTNKTLDHIAYIFNTDIDRLENSILAQNKGLSALCLLYKSNLTVQELSNRFGNSIQFNNINTASVPEFISAISNYIDIKTSPQAPLSKIEINNLPKSYLPVSKFNDSCKSAYLKFSTLLISRFICSLIAKPFVICSGLSGSGKTKLAQAFVRWICENEKQYKIIPVGADWTNREPLLGYPNGLDQKSYVTPDSGALQLIIEASKEVNENKPYFMILDEMNLSHVERYFADFLSIMESGEKLKLYSGEKRYSKYIDGTVADEKDYIPQEIKWPKNLFIIGTVNIDETTYMFSPKVLDRANVIEFRISKENMIEFYEELNVPDMNRLFLNNNKESGGVGKDMGQPFLNLAKDKTIPKKNEKDAKSYVLNKFFIELQNVGAEFGYRSAAEIELLITKLGLVGLIDDKDKPLTDDVKIDIAIMQKLLPKLHGSRKKLVGPLETLAGLCLNHENVHPELKPQELYKKYVADNTKTSEHTISIKYPISFEKIERMLKNAIDNGFTSYAEA